MSQHERANLARLQADLEQATRDAKELIQKLSASLHERTRRRETHLVDAAPPASQEQSRTSS
jgi:hypothetical protein